MSTIRELLREHAERYPLMAPSDAVKLLYQNEFGGGHLVENEAQSLAYLRSELETVAARRDAPRQEDIGNGYARLYLRPGDEDLAPLYNRIFVLSSRRADGSRERFLEKLDELYAVTEEGFFSFGTEELADYLVGYRAVDYPPVSHSEAYRTAYRPAYRVIDARYLRYLPVLPALSDLFRREAHPVVCIDGRAASGKTTAAALLAPLFDAQVIHMDDFFLPTELRTPARYAEPGGNVHYERFYDEVISGIRRGEPFTYRVFDPAVMDYTGTRSADPSRPIFIEGSYSLHPYFGDSCSYRIFSDIDPALQRARVRVRNGEEKLQRFIHEWIPMEELYFDTYSIRDACDIILH